LFVSRQGGRLKRKQAHNILKDAFEACELPGQVTTHSLRKTFANHVLRASGGNIKVLQELLGHKHLSTTEVYLSFDVDELRSAVPDFGVLDFSHVSSNSNKIITFQPGVILT
jgi:integrase/recombinase XerC